MGAIMIKLTRINRSSLAVNSDLIKFVETAPDTVLTLSTGEKLVVSESLDEVIALVTEFRRSLLAGFCCLSSNPAVTPTQAEHPFQPLRPAQSTDAGR